MSKPTFALPHDPLTPLDPLTSPTPSTIRLLEQELYANAKAIPSDLGGGLQGHIGLLMPDAEYLALAPNMIGYVTPVCPDLPNYAGTTAIQRSQMQDAYKKELDSFNEARAVSNYLTQLIIAAVPTTYLKKIQHRKLGYANTTPKQMLAHLVDTYSVITSADIQANLAPPCPLGP
jgi:hypothetical protein